MSAGFKAMLAADLKASSCKPTEVEASASAPLALGTLNSHSGRFYLVVSTSSAEISPCCEPLMYKRHQYTQEPFSPEKLVNRIGGTNTGGG